MSSSSSSSSSKDLKEYFLNLYAKDDQWGQSSVLDRRLPQLTKMVQTPFFGEILPQNHPWLVDSLDRLDHMPFPFLLFVGRTNCPWCQHFATEFKLFLAKASEFLQQQGIMTLFYDTNAQNNGLPPALQQIHSTVPQLYLYLPQLSPSSTLDNKWWSAKPQRSTIGLWFLYQGRKEDGSRQHAFLLETLQTLFTTPTLSTHPMVAFCAEEEHEEEEDRLVPPSDRELAFLDKCVNIIQRYFDVPDEDDVSEEYVRISTNSQPNDPDALETLLQKIDSY